MGASTWHVLPSPKSNSNGYQKNERKPLDSQHSKEASKSVLYAETTKAGKNMKFLLQERFEGKQI